MDIDPIESATSADEENAATRDRHRVRLNSQVAITVALLATFLGVCKVKDDNIVQAMQQAQADKLDHWNFYHSGSAWKSAHAFFAASRLGCSST